MPKLEIKNISKIILIFAKRTEIMNVFDFKCYFEDTMKAGHYENDKKSVEIMIRSSADVVKDLVDCGARFAREADGSLAYTREGAHSSNRIIFHEDITGKEITSHLLEKVRTLPNVTIMEYKVCIVLCHLFSNLFCKQVSW